VLAVWLAAWSLGARHSLSVDRETERFFTLLQFALLNVGFTWLFYLALQAFVADCRPIRSSGGHVCWLGSCGILG
jgi:hypothetical protein